MKADTSCYLQAMYLGLSAGCRFAQLIISAPRWHHDAPAAATDAAATMTSMVTSFDIGRELGMSDCVLKEK